MRSKSSDNLSALPSSQSSTSSLSTFFWKSSSDDLNYNDASNNNHNASFGNSYNTCDTMKSNTKSNGGTMGRASSRRTLHEVRRYHRLSSSSLDSRSNHNGTSNSSHNQSSSPSLIITFQMIMVSSLTKTRTFLFNVFLLLKSPPSNASSSSSASGSYSKSSSTSSSSSSKQSKTKNIVHIQGWIRLILGTLLSFFSAGTLLCFWYTHNSIHINHNSNTMDNHPFVLQNRLLLPLSPEAAAVAQPLSHTNVMIIRPDSNANTNVNNMDRPKYDGNAIQNTVNEASSSFSFTIANQAAVQQQQQQELYQQQQQQQQQQESNQRHQIHEPVSYHHHYRGDSSTNGQTQQQQPPPQQMGYVVNGIYVPVKFSYDRTIIRDTQDSNSMNYKRRPFPRWDSTTESDEKISIMDSMMDLLRRQSNMFLQFQNDPQATYWDDLLSWVHTTDHTQSNNVVNWWQPEILYIVDAATNGVYVSHYGKVLADYSTDAMHWKINPTEELMKLALNLPLQKDIAEHRWPRLYRLLVVDKGSFPFIGHYCDYTGCNHRNWDEGKASIPMFTVAGSVTCNHTFPFPNYRTFMHAKTNAQHWDVILKEEYGYPHYPHWIDKIPKALWRGSLTGKMSSDPSERAPRWRLLHYVHSLESNLTQYQRDMFDVKMTQIPPATRRLSYIDPNELGGASFDHQIEMIDFQKYRAIIDADGHSWSSRFGDIICYSSVIIKVEPQYVDYFFYGDPSSNHPKEDINATNTLQPWKHYIPVKSDLSDLVEKVEYAIADENQQHIERIIRNANEWCQNNMIQTKVAYDVLDIWEYYLNVLDTSSSQTGDNNNWETQWKSIKDDIMQGPLQMVPIGTS